MYSHYDGMADPVTHPEFTDMPGLTFYCDINTQITQPPCGALIVFKLLIHTGIHVINAMLQTSDLDIIFPISTHQASTWQSHMHFGMTQGPIENMTVTYYLKVIQSNYIF